MVRPLALCSALALTLIGGCGDTGTMAAGDGWADVLVDTIADPDIADPETDDSEGDGAQPEVGPETVVTEDSQGPTGTLDDDEQLEIWDLGTVTIDPVDGTSETLTFDVPDDAVSFAITVEGDPGVYYTVEELIAPDGFTLVPGGWYASPDNPGGFQVCVPCENRVAASSGAHATLVPIAPAVPVVGGNHVFRLVAFDVVITDPWSPPEYEPKGGDVTVTVTIKRPTDGLPETGTLDLNLHFTGASDLTAETAPTDPRIIEALQTFEEIYAQLGLSVGQITWHDIDPAYAFVDGIMGPGCDFEAAAAQTAGAPPGVNFIFVDEIVDSSNPLGAFGVILGVSGGIPGPVGPQGSPRSAVIVDVSVPELAGEVPLGYTMAHEMGHFLGLFHSSEMPFVNLHDPLPDTAEHDTSNLMYFEASQGGTTLTPDQAHVVRGNPWVRHPPGGSR